MRPTSGGGFRYGALAGALWSLRGPVYFEEPVPTERAVRFRTARARGIAPLYDVYLPRMPARASALLVHGGGFTLGSRTMVPMRFLASRLVRAGIAVACTDYRLIFRGGRLDEALDDVRAALGHFRAHGERRHGLDPARLGMVGLSAGGTLAMLAAGSEPVHRLACAFGLYELDHLEGGLAAIVPRLLFRSGDRTLWHARSPRHAPQPSAPTLLLHGTADGLVPASQAEALAAHRRSLGLPTSVVLYPGAPHGFFQRDCPEAHAGAEAIAEHLTRERA